MFRSNSQIPNTAVNDADNIDSDHAPPIATDENLEGGGHGELANDQPGHLDDQSTAVPEGNVKGADVIIEQPAVEEDAPWDMGGPDIGMEVDDDDERGDGPQDQDPNDDGDYGTYSDCFPQSMVSRFLEIFNSDTIFDIDTFSSDDSLDIGLWRRSTEKTTTTTTQVRSTEKTTTQLHEEDLRYRSNPIPRLEWWPEVPEEPTPTSPVWTTEDGLTINIHRASEFVLDESANPRWRQYVENKLVPVVYPPRSLPASSEHDTRIRSLYMTSPYFAPTIWCAKYLDIDGRWFMDYPEKFEEMIDLFKSCPATHINCIYLSYRQCATILCNLKKLTNITVQRPHEKAHLMYCNFFDISAFAQAVPQAEYMLLDLGNLDMASIGSAVTEIVDLCPQLRDLFVRHDISTMWHVPNRGLKNTMIALTPWVYEIAIEEIFSGLLLERGSMFLDSSLRDAIDVAGDMPVELVVKTPIQNDYFNPYVAQYWDGYRYRDGFYYNGSYYYDASNDNNYNYNNGGHQRGNRSYAPMAPNNNHNFDQRQRGNGYYYN